MDAICGSKPPPESLGRARRWRQIYALRRLWYHFWLKVQSMIDFERAISSLDIRLFEAIQSQSTDEDKQTLLAAQLAVRELLPIYNYLEIGSYLGGSIQPYLFDDKCGRIFSIDKRPAEQPDERKIKYKYLNNSTARMMENLRTVSPAGAAKLTTIDGDTRTLDAALIDEKIQLCFIDGEHTDAAVISDFQFCRRVIDPAGGAILFHDSQITYQGIESCLASLKSEGVDFRAYILPHIVFVVELGNFPLHKSSAIAERLLNNHEAYLFSLNNNDHYRVFTNKLPFRLIRNFISRMKRANVSP